MIYGQEDWEFWIAVLKNGGGVLQLSEIGFYYRIKANSMARSLDLEKIKYLINYMSYKHSQFFFNQLGTPTELYKKVEQTKREHIINLKSEKFVLDLFLSTFFKFSLFGKYKSKLK